jgi:hypothetical protein
MRMLSLLGSPINDNSGEDEILKYNALYPAAKSES